MGVRINMWVGYGGWACSIGVFKIEKTCVYSVRCMVSQRQINCEQA